MSEPRLKQYAPRLRAVGCGLRAAGLRLVTSDDDCGWNYHAGAARSVGGREVNNEKYYKYSVYRELTWYRTCSVSALLVLPCTVSSLTQSDAPASCSIWLLERKRQRAARISNYSLNLYPTASITSSRCHVFASLFNFLIAVSFFIIYICNHSPMIIRTLVVRLYTPRPHQSVVRLSRCILSVRIHQSGTRCCIISAPQTSKNVRVFTLHT